MTLELTGPAGLDRLDEVDRPHPRRYTRPQARPRQPAHPGPDLTGHGVAEPDLDFQEFCRRSNLPRSERSWDLFAGECYGAAKPMSRLMGRATRSDTASRGHMHNACPCQPAGVQQTGRPDAVPGAVVTGTPTRKKVSRRISGACGTRVAMWYRFLADGYSNSALTVSMRSCRPMLAQAWLATFQRRVRVMPGVSSRARRTSIHPME